MPNAENPKNFELSAANSWKDYQFGAGLIFKDSYIPKGVVTISKKIKDISFTSQFWTDKKFKTSLQFKITKHVTCMLGFMQNLSDELRMSNLYSNAALGLTVKL